MPLSSRAAQFSPFAALTGHEAAIRETARLTDAFSELDEDRKRQLDGQLQLIKEHMARMPEVEITYFHPDARKKGGAYETIRGEVKKIDERQRQIVFKDGTALPLDLLFSIKGELFPDKFL